MLAAFVDTGTFTPPAWWTHCGGDGYRNYVESVPVPH